ncbi:MAG: hypothetical protein ACRYFS_00090 [Janthinobacterium lividum]
MHTFNQQQYLDEITALLAQAKSNLEAQAPEAVVYTLNIWTDPESAASAVSFDTKESSDNKIAFQNRQAASRRERLVASGNIEGAARWKDQEGRICNPADFALPNIAECTHSSMPIGWEEESEGKRWDILEPALLEVREMAKRAFSDLQLDPLAELSVNSRQDWYDHPCHIGSDLVA